MQAVAPFLNILISVIMVLFCNTECGNRVFDQCFKLHAYDDGELIILISVFLLYGETRTLNRDK